MRYTILIAIIAIFMANNAKSDTNCVNELVYHEARNQSFIGQIAVVNVAYNRAAKSGKSVCKEIYKPYQFSFHNKGYTPVMTDKEALKLAERAAFVGRYIDVTDGANYYNRAELGLRHGAKNKRVIGQHVFYKI